VTPAGTLRLIDRRPRVSSAWTRRLHRSAGRRHDLADHVGEPGMPDRPHRWRPAAPGVGAGLGDRQHLATDLHREPLGSHHLDGREPSKGAAATCFSSSAARRVTASSVSNWTIRRRAATSSWCSWLLRAGSRPLSMRSWRRQVEIDWALDPQRLGDLGDRPSGLGEVQDLAAELRWVAASSDAVLLASGSMRNPTTQLHRTGDDHQLGDRPAVLPWQVSQQPEHERLARRRGSTRPHRPATRPSSSSSPGCHLAGGTLWPAGTG